MPLVLEKYLVLEVEVGTVTIRDGFEPSKPKASRHYPTKGCSDVFAIKMEHGRYGNISGSEDN